MPMANGPGQGEAKRCLIHVNGIVQGVGFRPFVYNLASRYGLNGLVQNTSDGVLIDVEGEADQVTGFVDSVRSSPPPLAQITEFRVDAVPVAGYSSFTIVHSAESTRKDVLISPDVAVCRDCLADLNDPANRRHRYPLTNCTNCGPRYTIIRNVPYDRALTSMAPFALCPACQAEYDNPADRRFHAQPNACPVCGPQITITDAAGTVLPGAWDQTFRRLLRAGHTIAVKGLGGFHLACDAANPAAIAELRRRKQRPAKPLAIMARDMAVVRRLCRVSDREAAILESPAAPIVLLDRREHPPVSELLAPRLGRLGVMLPYTPLHHLLFDAGLDAIVLTSGNQRGLPLARTNAAAYTELGDVADYYLVHDREIVNRCDDSVLRVVDGVEYFYRRSRGYTPRPVVLPFPASEPVLALGGDMNNTFCLIRGRNAFPGPHIGNVDNLETEQHLLSALAAMQNILGVEPRIVAADLHPGYNTSRLATGLNARLYPVQHHHAHLASCLAEHGLDGPAIGIICDGTGYGTDGSLWGMEVLTGDYRDFVREYSLLPLPLPGGEVAIRQPWRMAVSYAVQYLPASQLGILQQLFPTEADRLPAVIAQARSGFNSPLTSGCGRLFDAVSALLGFCRESTYEGQAAIELGEAVAGGANFAAYPYPIADRCMDPGPLVRGIIQDLTDGVNRETIAGKFHATLVLMLTETALRTARRRNLTRAVLSGGVFYNEYLLTRLTASLTAAGLTVYRHRLVPTGDGGLALGQAVIAAARAEAGQPPE